MPKGKEEIALLVLGLRFARRDCFMFRAVGCPHPTAIFVLRVYNNIHCCNSRRVRGPDDTEVTFAIAPRAGYLALSN